MSSTYFETQAEEMVRGSQDCFWTGQIEATTKKRKEPIVSKRLRTASSWSPNDSAGSSETFVDSSAGTQLTSPSAAESFYNLDPHCLGRPSGHCQSSELAACPWLCPERDLYTPRTQSIIVPSQQQAPKPKVQPQAAAPGPREWPAHNPAAWPLMQLHVEPPLPSSIQPCGKQMRLDSYTIASHLASGQAPAFAGSWEPGFTSRRLLLMGKQPGLVQAACMLKPAESSGAAGMQGGQLEPWGHSGGHVFGSGPIQKSIFPNGHFAAPPCQGLAATSKLKLQALPRLKPACMQSRAAVPWGLAPLRLSDPSLVLDQWGRTLRLLPDTVWLTLHMFQRIQARGGNSGELGLLYLLGCLWVSIKHEECRFGMPCAQKVAALVAWGSAPAVRAATVNRMELLVLDLLGWQPLKGWDDLHFVKGKPRDRREVSELAWLSQFF